MRKNLCSANNYCYETISIISLCGIPGLKKMSLVTSTPTVPIACSRRYLLKVGGLGLLGLTLPGLLRGAEKQKNPGARANSVIFLYQFGGPSHLDMFDLKPNAPEGIRGPLKGMPSSAPGVWVCDQMPRV